MRQEPIVLVDLFDHMEWADARVWEAALKIPEARGDETLKWLMLHLHGVQKAFLDAWTNQRFAFRNGYSGTTLDAELASVRAYYPRGRSYLSALSAEQLGERFVLPWSNWIKQAIGRTPGPVTLQETIIQAITHSGHHRAQANARLRAIGAEPPIIDYIAWLWLELPHLRGLKSLHRDDRRRTLTTVRRRGRNHAPAPSNSQRH